MITTLKLTGIGATLSAGFLSGFGADAVRPAPLAGGKLYTERLSDDPAPRVALASAAGGATVGNAAGKGDRLRRAPDAVRLAGTITIESRSAPASSALVRTPVLVVVR